jgi:hypothetical protein
MNSFPCTKLDFLVRHVTVASFIPGRIRFYTNSIKGKTDLSRSLSEYLISLETVRTVEINSITGSVLIVYDPVLLQKYPKLMRVEAYIRIHVGRR